MELFGGIVVAVLVIGVLLVALGLVIFLFSLLAGYSGLPSKGASKSTTPGMNEGDFHSGPEGYSANTAYPDTFYGSGGGDDHDEGDFNR